MLGFATTAVGVVAGLLGRSGWSLAAMVALSAASAVSLAVVAASANWWGTQDVYTLVEGWVDDPAGDRNEGAMLRDLALFTQSQFEQNRVTLSVRRRLLTCAAALAVSASFMLVVAVAVEP